MDRVPGISQKMSFYGKLGPIFLLHGTSKTWIGFVLGIRSVTNLHAKVLFGKKVNLSSSDSMPVPNILFATQGPDDLPMSKIVFLGKTFEAFSLKCLLKIYFLHVGKKKHYLLLLKIMKKIS